MSAANFSDSHLAYLLRTARKLSASIVFLRSACLLFAALLGLALLAVVVDALVGLNTWGLLATDLFGVLCVLVGLGWIVRQIMHSWLDPLSAARQLERRLGISDSRLINALDLLHAAPAGASRELVKQTIRQGDEFAKDISLGQTVRLKPLLKAAGTAVLVVLIIAGSIALMPRVFATVVPRFLDPTGDHPPFTLVQFDVQVEPTPVSVGRPASIVVKLGGPETIERANVVFVDTGSAKVLKHPLLRRPSGEFVLPIDRAEVSREFYIETPRGRSARYSLTVLPVPTFESAQAAYTFPKYTQWPDSKHVLDSRGIRALTGTEVTVTITSNVPLKHAAMELVPQGEENADNVRGAPQPKVAARQPAEILLLPGANSRTVSGKFPLQFSGHFKIRLLGEAGVPGKDVLEGSLTALPDRPPQIEFTEPGPVLLAVEDFKIPVGLSAQDDVAIADVVLFASINGLGPHKVTLATDPPAVKADGAKPEAAESANQNTFKGRYEFDLAALGAEAGDVITYHATARDNAPPIGQTADTPTYSIQVISKEEYLDFARTKYQMDEIAEEFEQFQKQLKDLQTSRDEVLKEAEALEKKLADEGALNSQDQQRLEKLQKQLEEFTKQAEQLSKRLEERARQQALYDFEEQYKDQLQKLSKQVQQQADNARAAREAAEKLRKQPDNKQLKQELAEALEQLQKESQPFDESSREQLEHLEEDLKTLQQADQMLAQAERLQSLIQQQRELADKFGELKDVPQDKQTPQQKQRAQQLAKEQELLQQELEEVTGELEKLGQDAEKTLPKTAADAKKLAEAIRKGQVPGDQQQAAKQSRAGNGKDAHERADEAAKKLEAMQQDLAEANAESLGEQMSLDAGLGLPKPGGKQSLKQLARGRQMPGLGDKPGDQQGKQPGQSPGQQPGDKLGKGEAGKGTQSKMQILGPHQPSSNKNNSRQARNGQANGPGQGDGQDQQGRPAAESITPKSASRRLNTTGNLKGVPVRYRDQAEAFFKRLAEEK